MNSKIIKTSAFLIAAIFLFYSCKKEPSNPSDINNGTDIESLNITNSFSFETTYKVEFEILALSSDNSGLSNIPIKIYSELPKDEDGNINTSAVELYSGGTNSSGLLRAEVSIPKSFSSVYLVPQYLGFVNYAEVSINSTTINYTFGGYQPMFKGMQSGYNTAPGYDTLGSWTSNGVPLYLETPDVIDNVLLADISSTLPESATYLHIAHPEYFSDTIETNLVIEELSEVFVTFISEGAGYKNTLAYYTYHVDSAPPTSMSDIDTFTLIYPNVSAVGSGGGLQQGDKVLLDTFPANTKIGWMLVANGWHGPDVRDINGSQDKYFSDKALNPESDPAKKQHTVLLYDNIRDLYLLGFEDLNREGSCDHDFNDAVFYAVANPIDAVDTTGLPKIDPATDADGDGVPNPFDAFPSDPNKAYKSHQPGENVFGTLAFEDLWPGKGDYDFNDLVINYNYELHLNANNEVVEMQGRFVPRAAGASYDNSFGTEINVSPGNIATISGGIENIYGTSKAVLMLFDDVNTVLPYPNDGNIGVNTVVGGTYVQPDTITQIITFTNPVSTATLGSAPFNPFIRIDGELDREVHLPDYAPTEFSVNSPYFGSSHDDSNPTTGRYYKTKTNLPWAIHIPVSFDYPIEKIQITEAYLQFGNWAEQNGPENWYENIPGFIDATKIY